MPKAEQHRTRVEYNRRFLAAFDPAAFPEWASVVAFYTAVHEIERLRAATGDGHSDSHALRAEYVHARHPDLTGPLRVLRDIADTARYDSRQAFFAKLAGDPSRVQGELIDRHLAVVSQYIAQRLA
jgi:hypothetical protein